MNMTEKMLKIFISFSFIFFVAVRCLFGASFYNDKLTADEIKTLQSGQVLIKSIGYQKNMCLKSGYSKECDDIIQQIKDLNPKYLAEIIQIKPYKGNENLPEVLTELLYNVSEYTNIPYYSVRHDKWYDLYDYAEIQSEKVISSTSSRTEKELKALFVMEPFGDVFETITMIQKPDSVYYSSVNTNKLAFEQKIDCVWPKKLKICIYLFREGDNWILYGVGGVNAPRIPFFTERIEVSFINRIKSFCNYMFTKF
ncbi:MAG: hypothetical protein IKX70_04115 [Treponema sp.]|nr:hypothetical protein [Treponema sp.]